MRYRPEQRLRRQRDFRAAREQGRRIECGGFTLWWYRRQALACDAQVADEKNLTELDRYPGARVGVVASRAAVGGAVERNRAKRRLREVFRAHQDLVPPGIDLLLIARRSANEVPYEELKNRFAAACAKLFPGK